MRTVALGIAVLLAVNALVLASRAGIPLLVAPTALASALQPAAPAALATAEVATDAHEPEPEAGVPPPAEVASETEEVTPPPEPKPAGPPEVERIPLVAAEPRLAAFRGLSTWVDLHDIELEPEAQVQRAAAGGVQTIFVQTARFNSPADIHDPGRLGRLIEAAHDRGMQVMAWYIPDFVDPVRDLRRSQAAISFRTPRGDKADAFGLDIEVEHMPDIATRNRRLVALSNDLRQWVGPDYPMAAIVLPPLQLDLRPSWWPNFPWTDIRPYYDVFVPMSYSSFRSTDAGTTYDWNFRNIIETRRRAGDPNLPIHMAGGIADRLPHVDRFVAALADGKILGGGLYDLHTTRPDAWPRLRALRAD